MLKNDYALSRRQCETSYKCYSRVENSQDIARLRITSALGWSYGDIKTAQKNDAAILKIYDWVEKGCRPNFSMKTGWLESLGFITIRN